MKYLFATLIVLFVNITVFAQSPGIGTTPPAAIRFNILGLFDFLDGNLSAGVELPVNPRLSFTTDLALIMYSAYIQESKAALGYMVKPALRYYTSDNHRGFIEGVLFYKQVGYRMEDWLDKQPVNGAPTYQQFEKFTLLKRVIGLNFQAGLQRNISKNKLLKLEGYLGVGARVKWQSIKNNPDATYQGQGILFSRNDNSNQAYIFPALPLGLRLVYVIE